MTFLSCSVHRLTNKNCGENNVLGCSFVVACLLLLYVTGRGQARNELRRKRSPFWVCAEMQAAMLKLLSVYPGNHSRRLSTDHSKTDRGSRRRKALGVVQGTCQSVPASPPTTNLAAGAPTVRTVDRGHEHSGNTVEPTRLRRSLRGMNIGGTAEPV